MTLNSEPPTLDWNLATDNVSFLVITNIMEGLTEYDAQLRPRPAIAKRWDVSPDGKTYTFYLREDATWNDGQPVTAADFEYSWKRLLDPKTAAEYAYFLYDVENAYEYNTGIVADADRVGVKALGDFVLRVRLKKPIVYFPSITTFMVTFPLRKDVVETYQHEWAEPGHMVTNGPFEVVEWQHEYKIRLKANRYYYGDPVSLEEVRMFVVNEATTALTLYETGDLEMVHLPPEAIPSYAGRQDYFKQPLLRGYYYGMNIDKLPFDDVRVRRAISMAVNREEFPKILRGGEVSTASWIPPGMFGYNAAIGYRYDPEGARRLLAAAGYPNGEGFPAVTAAFNTGPVHTLIAENLQAQWKRNLGISIQLENQEWKVYLKRLQTDTPALYRLGWGADYPDPDNFMVLFTSTSGNNHTHWKNSRYDELIGMGAVERDWKRRQAIYDEAQRILLEEAAVILPLFVASQNVLIKPSVSGLELNALELVSLKKVTLWEKVP